MYCVVKLLEQLLKCSSFFYPFLTMWQRCNRHVREIILPNQNKSGLLAHYKYRDLPREIYSSLAAFALQGSHFPRRMPRASTALHRCRSFTPCTTGLCLDNSIFPR